MTFAAGRVSLGSIPRRALRFGAALPVMEAFNDDHSNSNGFTVTKPPDSVDGDLLVISCTRHLERTLDQTTGGWTPLWTSLLVEGARSSSHHGFFRMIQAGDTTWDFLYPTNPGGDIEITTYRISGHDPTTPIAAFDFKGTTGSSTEIVIPAITSDITNCLLLHFVGKSDVLSGTITPPGDAEIVTNNDDRVNIQHLAAHEDFLSGGGTGTRTYGMSASVETNFGALVLIQPSESVASRLLLENGTDRLLFEDSSGVLLLE